MFQKRIQEKYELLSPRFRVLADFILENTLDAGFLTATELARRVNIDPATVVRFSQELGYSGYRELSREIKRYVNKQLALRYQEGDPGMPGLAGKIAVLTDELSDRVLNFKVEASHIATITEILHAAPHIYVLGKGDSFGLASLWVTYLNFIGHPASAVHANLAQAALMLRDAAPGAVLFAISLGLDPDSEIGQLVSAAQSKGIKTIVVSTSPTLLPARQADINLNLPAETPAGYPSFDTLMALLSLLWQALIALDEKKAHAAVRETADALSTLIGQKDRIPAHDIAAMQRLWKQE
ncbi:MAG: MurR/RpiR family transcriptional regulator [Anaerolineae bacterium]|jgi:DNA-binding MurR/RpiR family transcriptional regulator|nr:MurR/RpiR family transcriptional regulator [Anaerolineae bacterium]